LLQYAHPSLHDITPLNFYSNFTRLDMEHVELPEFDSYKTFDSQFTPSWTGKYTLLIVFWSPPRKFEKERPILSV